MRTLILKWHVREYRRVNVWLQLFFIFVELLDIRLPLVSLLDELGDWKSTKTGEQWLTGLRVVLISSCRLIGKSLMGVLRWIWRLWIVLSVLILHTQHHLLPAGVQSSFPQIGKARWWETCCSCAGRRSSRDCFTRWCITSCHLTEWVVKNWMIELCILPGCLFILLLLILHCWIVDWAWK